MAQIITSTSRSTDTPENTDTDKIINLQTGRRILKVIIDVLMNYDSSFQVILLFIAPIIISVVNIHVHSLLAKENQIFSESISWKMFYDYLIFFVQSNIMHRQTMRMFERFKLRIELAKIKCGTPIPGENQKQYKDLMKDCSKLRDFLFVIPVFWSTIVSFVISIYNMETQNDYDKIVFTLLCICAVYFLTNLTDQTLYEKTKSSNTEIRSFSDSDGVRTRMGLGYPMNIKYESEKKNKIEEQQNIRKVFILLLNSITNGLSLASKNKGQLHSFGNISWMLGCLADNLKSFFYYEYMEEFISLTKCLESHKLESSDEIIPIGLVDKLILKGVDFGYYSGDLTKNPKKIIKIKNLSYVFERGNFYYLEAPNGIGKSTLLKCFTSNVYRGEIYFGSVNRKNLKFEDVISNVYHIVQATEYTPKFDRDETIHLRGKDEWLEEKLGLKDLLGKDTIELSGGQKKRVFIYGALTSNASIILLDEICSELSTEDTPEVPEGGGWLTRIINTLGEWDGIQNKIIIMVGHGLVDLMPSKVVKLKIENTEEKTLIHVR
jgi:ABC-type cobalamin/Fe3+-siderophores transport system ATPase subunit